MIPIIPSDGISTILSRTGYICIMICLGVYNIGWMKSIPTEMTCYMIRKKSLRDNRKEIRLQKWSWSRRDLRTDSCALRIWIWRNQSRISRIIVGGCAWAAVCGTKASTAAMTYCIYRGAATIYIFICIMLRYLFILGVCACTLCDRQLFLYSINTCKCSGRNKPYPVRRELIIFKVKWLQMYIFEISVY